MPEVNRIGVVAGDEDLLEGLRLLVDSQVELKLVFAQTLGQEALVRLPQTTIDVLVVDLRLSDMSGVEFISKLSRQAVETNDTPPYVVLQSAFSSREVQLAGLEAGCDAYVGQDAGAEEILKLLRATSDQRSSYDYQKMLELFDELGVQTGEQTWMAAGKAELSATQVRIFDALKTLASDEEIAGNLALTKSFVTRTIRDLLSKFGLTTRYQLLLALFRGGLIELP